MGATSADTQREIESLRDDISATVEELERRARRTLDLRAQAEEHPGVLAVVGAGLLIGVGMVAYNAMRARQQSRKPVNRLRRHASDIAEDVGERWEHARERLPRGTYFSDGEGESVDASKQEPGMLKTVLWMALTAGTIAMFGLLARRVSSAIWQAVMGEPPPTSKV